MTIQNASLAAASMSKAMTDVGQKETTGHNDGPFVNMLEQWYDGHVNSERAWCAMFCMWCIYMAAEDLSITPVLPKTDSSSDLYAFAARNQLLLDEPITQCIGLLKGDPDGAGKTHHHTFRVIAVDFDQEIVHSVDGNWGNAVSLTTHRMSDCDFAMVV